MFHFMSFWSINGPLKVDLLCQQLEDFRDLGFDGVIFHPRYYPGKPEYLGTKYMEILSTVILHAKKIGLLFWLYDEDGWPSGSAGGKVLEALPDSTCEWLVLEEGEVIVKSMSQVNTLNPACVQTFIDITYEGYKKGLTPEAFEVVTGFFSDEVDFPGAHHIVRQVGIPWSSEVENRYLEKYGESVIPYLKDLFINVEDEYSLKSSSTLVNVKSSDMNTSNKDSSMDKGRTPPTIIRFRVWEILTDLLADTFYKPINDWCKKNNKLYTMHLKGEENLFFQIPYSGSTFQHLKCVSLPGIDALERFPGNHYFPHIVSSLAKQFGNGQSLCEALGGSGWGLSPKSFSNYIKWLMDCGITQFVFHISQYQLTASAIRDWPPSMPFHLSWREAFPEIIEGLKTYGGSSVDCISSGRIIDGSNKKATPDRANDDNDSPYIQPVLLVAPTRGVMKHYTPSQGNVVNEHNGARLPHSTAGLISKDFSALVESCHQVGLIYDVTEERILEQHAFFEDDKLHLGKMCYDKVITGRDCTWVEEIIKEKIDSFDRSNHQPWTLMNPEDNLLLLELQQVGNILTTTINHGFCDDFHLLDKETQRESNSISLENSLSLEISDPVESHSIDWSEDTLQITVKPLSFGEQQPFVWLKGDFLVQSLSPYEEKDEQQLMTAGPFCLMPAQSIKTSSNLNLSGYPFRITPFLFEKEILLAKKASKIIFSDVHCHGAKVWINQEFCGWLFGPSFQVDYPFNTGKHTIQVELYPSTFNKYGPHHHMDGDRHLTSPGQYSGVKNFADHVDAPENTHVPEWHFVRCGISSTVIFL